jgi:DNA-binding NarL/FixJ family response regulator
MSKIAAEATRSPRVLRAALGITAQSQKPTLINTRPLYWACCARVGEFADELLRRPKTSRSAQSQAASDSEPSLTARECEVAVLITRGLTNDEVAQSLHISRHTVGTYIKRMYQRLGFATRVELTRNVLDHHLGDE